MALRGTRPRRRMATRARWRATLFAASLALLSFRITGSASDGGSDTGPSPKPSPTVAPILDGVPLSDAGPSRAQAAGGVQRTGPHARALVTTSDVPLSQDCRNSSDPVATADELMANGYRLGTWPLFTLPADLKWTENPPADANWAFQLHSARYVLDLIAASRITADLAYQDRGLALLQDWIKDNPRHSSPSIWAWNDHSTALRAVVLACTADLTPMTTWLHDSLILHGETLADPGFYRMHGNHALNQNIGLLEVARVLGRADWLTLASNRMNTLITESIDSEGITNEQSVGYELYNYKRYRLAENRMLAVGLTPGDAFARLDLMPEFLAQATIPNGYLEMIGDTSGIQKASITGTTAEFAATSGASGPKPTRAIVRFRAGYLFARTGWGEHRPAADETFFSVNWGAGPVFHGHPDGENLTLASFGSRLLVDPGLYSYTSSSYRTFFKSRSANNVVTIDGATWNTAATTRLLGYTATSHYVDVRLGTAGYAGVNQTRHVTYSRGLNYLLVEDRNDSSSVHTYRQLWHLSEDSRPAVGASSVWTQKAKGNLIVRQLAGAPKLDLVKGRTSPVQGWISYSYGTKVAAPVAEAVQTGSHVRYLTLIVPSSGRPTAKASQLVLTSTGYSVTITIGVHSERVTVSGSSIWMHTLS